MPWAQREPAPLDDVVARLEGFRAQFDRRDAFFFGIFARDEAAQLGAGGFHPRVGAEAMEIGYWVRADRTRQGIATEAVAALTRAGFELGGWERLEIHVDPRNTASLGVPRALGYLEEATLRRRLPPVRPDAPRGDVTIFSMLAEEFEVSPLKRFPLTAYDSAGGAVM